MAIYVADRETGTFIEEVLSVSEGINLIHEYEESDMYEGIYTEDFYDVVDENRNSLWMFAE